jgi:hypothetical protein
MRTYRVYLNNVANVKSQSKGIKAAIKVGVDITKALELACFCRQPNSTKNTRTKNINFA